MKKSILIVVSLFVTLVIDAQVRFGVKAGFTGATMKMENLAYMEDFHDYMLPAYHAGILADIPLAKEFSLQPELIYNVKGYKMDLGAVAGYPTRAIAKYRYNYLELPVNFVFKTAAGPGRIFVGLGGYIAYGIGGKVSDNSTNSMKKVKDIKFDGEEKLEGNVVHANAMDAGVNFLTGYEFNNGVSLGFSYYVGFMDTNPAALRKDLQKGITFSVGYFFNRK